MLATLLLRKQRLPRGAELVRTPSMGMTSVSGMVQRPDGRGRRRRVTFPVDSGAVYSVLPPDVCKALGLKPTRLAEFALADGTTIGRGVAEARFTIAGVTATSPVVCGEDRDGARLGAVTLETLGLMLNPLSRELLPMRLRLTRTAS
jgi:predicted aspartyl protease